MVATGDDGRHWAHFGPTLRYVPKAFGVGTAVEIIGLIVTARECQATFGCQVNVLLTLVCIGGTSVHNTLNNISSLNWLFKMSQIKKI
jgi:hypothetical protein